MRQEKLEELKQLRNELSNLGLIVDDDMKIYRVKRIIKEYQILKTTTELITTDIKNYLENNQEFKFTYYKMDKYDLYDKFFNGKYEMIYLPLEDIVFCKAISEEEKKQAKKNKLYHESYFEKYLLFYRSELTKNLNNQGLTISEENTYLSNRFIEYVDTVKSNEKVRKL